MGVLQDAYNYFINHGWGSNAAAGISAGLYAESGLNPTNVNPSSGAYGIGQWLGSRQQNLFGTYGANPSFSQQLDFVNQELSSGNGGSTIANSSSPSDALNSFINLFERPGPGTSGDLTRGNNALTQLGAPTDPLTGGSNALAGSQDWLSAIINDTLQGVAGVPDLPDTIAKKAGDAVSNATSIWSVFTEGVWTRFSFGLVGALLIAAAIFILLGGPKVVVQTAKKAAKAAIAA